MWYDGGGSAWRGVNQDELGQVAKVFLEKARHLRVWLLYGEMGSGKTTFVKSLCAHLGVTDMASSPTFSIVNEYETNDHGRIYHFDFYRIKNEAEAFDIGTEEYFYSGHLCLVEWPEKIPSLIPPDHVEVSIAVENPNQRTIAISVHDGQEKKRI